MEIKQETFGREKVQGRKTRAQQISCRIGLRVDVLFLMAMATAGCRDGGSGSTSSHTAPAPVTATKPWQLIISGDTRGSLIPCGCTSNQSGGLPRRAAYLAERRRTHEVLLLDAGGAPGGDSPYDRLRFEAILKGETLMGLAAHNLGEPELRMGFEWLNRIAERLSVPFITANASTTNGQQLGFSSKLLGEAKQDQWLVVGVVSPTVTIDNIRISDPAEAVLREWEKHAALKPKLVVLAWMPEAELRALAQRLPEADLVVGSFAGQALAPERIGRTVLATAANKGKFLIEATVSPTGLSPEVVEMTSVFADDPGQLQILQAFRENLEEFDLPAIKTSFRSSRAIQTPTYVRFAGSDQCRECHAAENDVWHGSAHAHAWQTLTKQHAHVDAACQVCHTTGFGFPAGFESVKRSPQRVDVGCESCHGPSESHVREPASFRTPFRAADQCLTCHDPENSPHFEFAAYWDRIRHGKRPAQETAP